MACFPVFPIQPRRESGGIRARESIHGSSWEGVAGKGRLGDGAVSMEFQSGSGSGCLLYCVFVATHVVDSGLGSCAQSIPCAQLSPLNQHMTEPLSLGGHYPRPCKSAFHAWLPYSLALAEAGLVRPHVCVSTCSTGYPKQEMCADVGHFR